MASHFGDPMVSSGGNESATINANTGKRHVKRAEEKFAFRKFRGGGNAVVVTDGPWDLQMQLMLEAKRKNLSTKGPLSLINEGFWAESVMTLFCRLEVFKPLY